MQETIMSHGEEKQPPRIRDLDISEERVKELCKEMNDLNRRMREIGRKLNQLRMDCALLTIEQATLCDPVTRDALSLAFQGKTYFAYTPDQPEPSAGTPSDSHAPPPSAEPVAAVREEGGGTGEGLPKFSERCAEEGNLLDANGTGKAPGLAERRTSQPDEQHAGSSLRHFDVDLTKPPPGRDPGHPDAVGGRYSVPPPPLPPPNPCSRDSVSLPFPPPPPPPPPGWNAEISALALQTAIPPEVDLTKPPPRWTLPGTAAAPLGENPEGEGLGAGDESPV
ncbi:pistil-specific extensin-like protein isoform X2 [Penaeus chinensis]|nr:pistil-specific extensin-like protein isoform X2 [Penaeus chinensis]